MSGLPPLEAVAAMNVPSGDQTGAAEKFSPCGISVYRHPSTVITLILSGLLPCWKSYTITPGGEMGPGWPKFHFVTHASLGPPLNVLSEPELTGKKFFELVKPTTAAPFPMAATLTPASSPEPPKSTEVLILEPSDARVDTNASKLVLQQGLGPDRGKSGESA